MSQSPKSAPPAVLQPNRNHDFKVPFAPDLAKSSQSDNNWRQSLSLSNPNSPCQSPLKQGLNDENRNPDKALQPVPVRPALQMDTPGKHRTEICSQFASLQLYTPDAGNSGKGEQTKSITTKLPFSESFEGASRVCERLAPASKESSPSHRPTRTLIITEDEEEYFMDASEYLDYEENQGSSSDQMSEEGSPEKHKTTGAENIETASTEAGTDQMEKNEAIDKLGESEISQLKLKETSAGLSKYDNSDDLTANAPGSKQENTADLTDENSGNRNELTKTPDDKTIYSSPPFGEAEEPGVTGKSEIVCKKMAKSPTNDKSKSFQDVLNFFQTGKKLAKSPASEVAEPSDEAVKSPASEVAEPAEEAVKSPANELAEPTEEAVKSPANEVAVPAEEAVKSPANEVAESADKPAVEKKSESFEDIMTPFETGKQLANSPVCKKAESAVEKKSESFEDIMTPFQTGKQLANSPVCKKAESAEEAVKSPVNKMAEPAEKVVKSAIERKSVSFEDIVTPFQTGKQLANSPVCKKAESAEEEVKSPVTEIAEPAQKVVKSPANKETESAKEAVKSAVEKKSESFEDIVSPFQTGNQLANSPVCKKAEFAEETVKSAVEKKSESFEDIMTPFETGKQLANSPVCKKAESAEETVKSAVEKKSESFEDIMTPFETGKQLANSPVCKKAESAEETVKSAVEKKSESFEDIMTPFETGKQLANSPVCKKAESAEETVKSAVEKKSESFEDIMTDITSTSVSGLAEGIIAHSSCESTSQFADNTVASSDEIFRSATEVFGDDAGWELFYGDKQTIANASHLCRESLYVKFDPLVDLSYTPKDHAAKMKKIARRLTLQKKKSPPKSPNLIMLESPDLIMLESPISKRQSVHQKEAGYVGEGKKSTDIDDLFSLTPQKDDVLQYTDLLKMKQHMEFECQNRLMSVCKEMSQKNNKLQEEREEILKSKEAEYNKKIKELETRWQEISTVQNESTERIAQMKKLADEHIVVVEHLLAEKKKMEEESSNITCIMMKENAQTLEELHAMEKAFSDLHRRFEKSRTIIEGFQKNEEVLKNHVKDLLSKEKEGEAANAALEKEHQENKMNFQSELTVLKKKLETDTSRFQALVRQKDMENSQLKSELEMKNTQVQELRKICDELLEKVSNC